MRAERVSAELGIVLNQWPVYPSDSESHEEQGAARLADALCTRWYMDPLFIGAYPADGLAFLGADAPKVLDGDFDIISQPIDFLGINYYTRQYGAGVEVAPPAELGVTDMGWEIYPDGLMEHLVRIARSYNPPPIYIMENGAATADTLIESGVHDPMRIDYLRRHIDAVKQARLSGVNVKGYFAWSLMDNYEWDSGYDKRFGLVYVDYANQKRYLKDSAHWYRGFIATQRAEAEEDRT
jgi:beta-glucosidase